MERNEIVGTRLKSVRIIFNALSSSYDCLIMNLLMQR